MTNDTHLENLSEQYSVVGIVDLSGYQEVEFFSRRNWITKQIQALYKTQYQNNERILVKLMLADNQYDSLQLSELLYLLKDVVWDVDISSFFIVVASNIHNVGKDLEKVNSNHTLDPVPIVFVHVDWSPAHSDYSYNSTQPLKISLQELQPDEKFLLTESKTFCMYPWIHLHAYPTGAAYPCCMAEMKQPIGNTRNQTLSEIWNGSAMKEIRVKMLANQPVQSCSMCYEKEASGFFSGRLSANKHHGHHIDLVHQTQQDGALDEFRLIYWDIRFSNLCNLKCRSCGHIFSSNWFSDQAQLAGPEWKNNHQVLNYAGRSETDIWEQLVPHLDYVEQIYFAGGEPLLMAEHYNILEELERRKKFNVRLIYNTNFTHTQLKSKSVFEYWKKFDSVSVGASLDASGARAKYIRSGTDWDQVVENRKKMLEICPRVDFYISPTLSIMNAWHLPDFHREWVEQGLIRPQDLNVNILQDPAHYRLDIAPQAYKDRIQHKFQEHLDWLRPQDHLQRATNGFESAINFMNASDNSYLLPTFWQKTMQLDSIRNEEILEILPELEQIK